MKKFTSLLIGCSLALAGATFAQQPDEQQSPAKNKKPPVEKTQRAEQPKANVERPHRGDANANGANANGGANANTANPEAATSAKPQRGMHNERNAVRGNNPPPKTEASVSREKNTSAEAGASATVPPNKQAHQGRNGAKSEAAANSTKPAASATPVAAAKATPAIPATTATPATAAATTATTTTAADTSVAPNNQGNRRMNPNAKGAALNKPAPEKVQQIRQEHVSFRAQARPDKVPAVTFQQNYRIQGAERWQGSQYEVYRSYHPERHDRSWYHSHYQRVELVSGGYYYMNNGYWYPAWGYSPSEEYYAYDAPIYVGHRSEPPDRVIADVQSTLQEMGYYKGEVDGLLGPLTREALTAYQEDEGLMSTAVIDEPTLDSLGMS